MNRKWTTNAAVLAGLLIGSGAIALAETNPESQRVSEYLNAKIEIEQNCYDCSGASEEQLRSAIQGDVAIEALEKLKEQLTKQVADTEYQLGIRLTNSGRPEDIEKGIENLHSSFEQGNYAQKILYGPQIVEAFRKFGRDDEATRVAEDVDRLRKSKGIEN